MAEGEGEWRKKRSSEAQCSKERSLFFKFCSALLGHTMDAFVLRSAGRQSPSRICHSATLQLLDLDLFLLSTTTHFFKSMALLLSDVQLCRRGTVKWERET